MGEARRAWPEVRRARPAWEQIQAHDGQSDSEAVCAYRVATARLAEAGSCGIGSAVGCVLVETLRRRSPLSLVSCKVAVARGSRGDAEAEVTAGAGSRTFRPLSRSGGGGDEPTGGAEPRALEPSKERDRGDGRTDAARQLLTRQRAAIDFGKEALKAGTSKVVWLDTCLSDWRLVGDLESGPPHLQQQEAGATRLRNARPRLPFCTPVGPASATRRPAAVALPRRKARSLWRIPFHSNLALESLGPASILSTTPPRCSIPGQVAVSGAPPSNRRSSGRGHPTHPPHFTDK
ncbi:hypothetical protein Purlil1_11005 [Purpureocillium lilacinum]|uniref:Uncharacterized protein n=1 Tax=Purpureocillium lilacinum TaxID=33203 RepID=A0ABR0BKY3_PURLI|nr:hypothetical protein Purlil1_11005 [Purpureocillium lilacinum]